MNTQISGIPCQINVTHWEPPAPGDYEWEVLDRNGRRAPWLTRKLTPEDKARIETELRREREYDAMVAQAEVWQ